MASNGDDDGTVIIIIGSSSIDVIAHGKRHSFGPSAHEEAFAFALAQKSVSEG